jgi:hypothetical protein
MAHLFVIEKNAGIDLEDILADSLPASQRSAVDMCALMRMAKGEGMQLSGLIDNTVKFLILHASIVETLLHGHNPDHAIEVLPLVIINQKGRVASTDYRVVNPIVSVDCLDLDRSRIDRLPTGEIVKIEIPVLDAARINPSRNIFRLASNPYMIFVKTDVLSACQCPSPYYEHHNIVANPVTVV